MKVLAWILIPATLVLSYQLRIGRECVYPGDVVERLEDLRNVMILISDHLGYELPVLENGVLRYRGKSIEERDLGDLKLEDVLELFGVPFIREKDGLTVPECVVEDVKTGPTFVEVDYHGNPPLTYEIDGTRFKAVSRGYVLYGGRIYGPGEVVFSIPSMGKRIVRIHESLGRDVVYMEKYLTVKRLILEDFGEWGGRPIPSNAVLILIGLGSGEILIRPFSRDLKGLDFEGFKVSEGLAKRLSDLMDYSFEICPLIDLPVGAKAVAVFLKEEGDYGDFLNTLKELVDYETLDDRVDSIGHPGAGR